MIGKTEIVIAVDVRIPEWEYCNEQTGKTSRETGKFCKFHSGRGDERRCILFDNALYSSYDWVKKCDKCLAMPQMNARREGDPKNVKHDSNKEPISKG